MASKKHTILVIEDEALMAKTLYRKLKSESFNVIVARNGAEGLKLAISEHPDLILLDIILPVMDGLTFLEKLRENSWGKSVPVIVLSNLRTIRSIEESRKKGVENYLVKTAWKLVDVVSKVKSELNIQ